MHSLLKECENCNDLRTLYAKIECSILYAIKKKHNILIYNLEGNFDEERYKSLLRYKRIVGRRIYDCTYPSSCILTSTIIEKASVLALRGPNCSECETCFPDIT